MGVCFFGLNVICFSMPALRVSDIMREVPATIAPDASLRDAVRAMIEKKTNGLIVVQDDRSIAGIISSWDIIELIVPDYLEDDKHLAAFEAGDTFADRIKELAETKVEDFMTKEVRSVNPDDSVMQAATILSEAKIRQLPVVDSDGKLVAYLNRTDMKLAIAKVLGV